MPGHKTVQFVDGNLQLSGYRVLSVEGTVSKKEYFNSGEFSLFPFKDSFKE